VIRTSQSLTIPVQETKGAQIQGNNGHQKEWRQHGLLSVKAAIHSNMKNLGSVLMFYGFQSYIPLVFLLAGIYGNPKNKPTIWGMHKNHPVGSCWGCFITGFTTLLVTRKIETCDVSLIISSNFSIWVPNCVTAPGG